MGKSILISVRPENVVNILNGKKTLELRKSFPKDFIGWVYIYCTKGDEHLVDSKSWIDFINKGRERTKISKRQRYYTISKKWEGDIYGDVLNGKVVARFWFDEYEKVSLELIDKSGYDEDRLKEYESEKMTNEELLKKICLSDVDIDNYLNSYDGYAWHIKKLEIFDEPLMLSDFYKTNIPYLGIREIKYALDYYGKEKVDNILKYSLKRAPQSWCYVYTNEQILEGA